MVIIGWLTLAAGAALLLSSLGMTLRANAGRVVPFNRNPEVVPRHTVLMRAVGAGLFVAAAVLLGSTTGYWVVIAPAVIVTVGLIAMVRHNRKAGRTNA